jgi:uncharacterized protein
MKGYLLDVNSLIALAWPNHPQHGTAHEWFARAHLVGWGTCLVTQLGFVRISSNPAIEHHVSTQNALQKLKEIIALRSHTFWGEPPNGYNNKAFSKTVPSTLTHGLVTDGYLATVAALHEGKLATFDRQLARTFGDLAVLIEKPS